MRQLRSFLFWIFAISIALPAFAAPPPHCPSEQWAGLAKARGSLAELETFLRDRFPTFSRISSSDNLRFRELARLSPLNPERPRLFLDTELAILKELNDQVFPEAKGFVTALANAYKEMFFQEIQRSELLRAEIRGQYSDFKSLRFAFQNDSPELRQELAKVYDSVARRYSLYLESYGLHAQLKNQRGIAALPASWHLAGVGADPDQANMAARFARSRFQADGTPLQEFRTIRAEISELARNSRILTQEIAEKLLPRFPRLFQAGAAPPELHSGAVEILLKTRPATRSLLSLYSGLYSRFLERFGVRLTPDDLRLLVEWKKSVDLFQPGIYVGERDPVQLDGALEGALFLDIAGQNVRNFQHTARALQSSASANVDETIARVRAGEVEATAELDRRRNFLTRSLDLFFGAARGHTYQSGDDAAFVPTRALSRLDRVRLYREIANSNFSGDFRLSFVEPRYGDTDAPLPPSALERLGGVGDALEKELRKALEPEFQKAGFSHLRELFLAVEVTPRESASARAIIYLGANSAHWQKNVEVRASTVARELGISQVEVRILP